MVGGLFEGSKFLIEWTAPEAGLDLQVDLVELQVQLARWQQAWAEVWSDSVRRIDVVEQARAWSEKLLAMSGLMR